MCAHSGGRRGANRRPLEPEMRIHRRQETAWKRERKKTYINIKITMRENGGKQHLWIKRKDLSECLARWFPTIEEFNAIIKYLPGEALSRNVPLAMVQKISRFSRLELSHCSTIRFPVVITYSCPRIWWWSSLSFFASTLMSVFFFLIN